MNHSQHINLTIKRMVNLGGGGKMPRTFQQVEYLQGTGTQYIVTNCGIELGQEIHVGFMLLGTAHSPVYGAYTGSAGPTQYLNANVSVHMFRNFAANWRQVNHNMGYNTKYDIIAQRGSWVTINGVGYQLQTYGGYEGDVSSAKLEIFARGIRTDPNYLNGRIYYFYVLDSTGNKQCDIIPCYRKSDNKPGMYDLVTRTFFTNAGTGEFTVGNNV